MGADLKAVQKDKRFTSVCYACLPVGGKHFLEVLS
jgi:hypothetical protein